jgi:hypothetical protein
MQFLNFVLLQLDEACRHIKDGRLAQLRIALLLLDNAAEIQMERCASNHLMHEAMQERIRHMVFQIPEDKRGEHLQKLADWEPLTYSAKHKVSRNFDDKVKYLSERTKQLDSRLAGPLIHLHRYRNEAYHHARVRKDTIETAARLLLEIYCTLLLSLSRGGTAYASNEDYSWLAERFGKHPIGLMADDNNVPKAVQEFRNIFELDDNSVSNLLTDHLLSRIQGVLDSLAFIVENTGCPDRETAIRDSHAFNVARCKEEGRGIRKLVSTEDRHSLTFLSDLRKKVKDITRAANRLDTFDRFSLLESEFEPVEQSVHELAAEVDRMIQMEIDIARGK